ncbi:START domain-containing protein [Lacimicrobium sp. SS2-24]|uniref:START domain-containing protein n=1 Tax=Lacimicrobium sp. SS2-24 TaxID=2005569 RepID=UPI000B4B4FE8|nr:START domain-containing protein [Lacimicrobium sp. SS2-24]
MQFPLFLLLLFCALFARASCMDEETDWALEKSSQQVSVYGRQKADYYEIMATVRVQASPVDFLTLLRNTEKGPQWIHNASQITLIDQPDPQTDLVHTVFDSPWPFRDRDMVTLSRIHENVAQGELRIDITDASTRILASADHVRMQQIRGIWRLRTTKRYTQICYQGSGHAGGNIPDWLARSLLVSGTYKSFSQLAEILGRYQPKKN